MELRHLRYFVAVAEELHFSRAAQRLHIAQPPLSQQIRNLETELGVQLLQRTKHRVQLTAAGQLFLEEARRTLSQAEQAIRTAQRASRGEIGRLVVGFLSSTAYNVFPEILRLFRERFPAVELVLHELNTVPQVQALHEGQIDVGFLHPPVNSGEALSLTTVFEEPLVLALPSNHALAAQPQIALAWLADAPFVLSPRHLGPGFYDQVISACQQAGFHPRVVQETNMAQTMVSLVAGGMGVALVPASLQNLQRTGVVYRVVQDLTPRVTTAAIWRREDASLVLHAFLEGVREIAQRQVPTVAD